MSAPSSKFSVAELRRPSAPGQFLSWLMKLGANSLFGTAKRSLPSRLGGFSQYSRAQVGFSSQHDAGHTGSRDPL